MTLSGHLAYHILLGSLEILAIFSAFLIVFIILYRYFSSRRERWFEYHYQRITEELLDMLTNSDPKATENLAFRNKNYPGPLTHALLDLARRIKGPERQKLAAVFKLALEAKVRKDLRSPFLLRRLTAARLLEFFSEPPEPELVQRLLKDKPPVRLAAISALANAPSSQTIRYIFQALETDPSPNYQTYLEILFPLGEALENELRSALKRPLQPELTAFYIELAGLIPLRRLYPDLLPFISSENKEIRIRAARAISRMELPESLPVLMKLANDPAWEVQAQAVLGLGWLKNPEVIPVLSQALRSPHWHVRLNAKEALLLLGEPGIACLKKMSEQTEDRFAADMAKMGLKEYQELYEKI
ncbi:MAG: HEAT repeat domain-containing protein [Candidatus Aminicenantes bacterium]|nr:HEAT repeat domain-containing protein [Candidatus Aminicenantes bacterium]